MIISSRKLAPILENVVFSLDKAAENQKSCCIYFQQGRLVLDNRPERQIGRQKDRRQGKFNDLKGLLATFSKEW